MHTEHRGWGRGNVEKYVWMCPLHVCVCLSVFVEWNGLHINFITRRPRCPPLQPVGALLLAGLPRACLTTTTTTTTRQACSDPRVGPR